MAEHEIKTIVAELQSMSPRTQLEIVRLCKKVAELTPDYIDTLSEETKAELRPLIDANAAAINQEVIDRKAIVENVNGENKLKTTGTSEFAGVYVSDGHTDIANEHEIEITNATNSIMLEANKIKITSRNHESTFDGDTFATEQIEATDVYADGIYSKPNSNEILIDCGNKQIKLDKSTHEITLTNNQHVLKLDANGSLTLDGAAVGGGSDTYVHIITFTISGVGDFCIEIINTQDTAYTSASLAQWLSDNNFNSSRTFKINELVSANGTSFYRIDNIYNASGGSTITCRYTNLSNNSSTTSYPSFQSDTFYKIS